jgi:hypothetical protein
VPPEARAYLRSVGFTDVDFVSLEGGGVVSRIVPRKEDNDAFIVGAVRIAAPAEALIAALQKIETLRNRLPIVQIGRFSTPPRIEDLDGLTFETKDLDALRACRVGDCDLKVGTAAMEAARTVDWKASDAYARASHVLKELIVGRVARYLQEGPSGMAVYNDNEIPESTAAEVAKIVGSEPPPPGFTPDFLKHVLDFPASALPGIESFVYWSKEKTRKTVVSVAHVSIQTIPRDPGPAYAVAMKHLYDSHYFLGEMEFLTLLPEAADKPRFTLIHVLRARVDPPRSFRGMLLGKMREGMREAIATDLQATRSRVESGATPSQTEAPATHP